MGRERGMLTGTQYKTQLAPRNIRTPSPSKRRRDGTSAVDSPEHYFNDTSSDGGSRRGRKRRRSSSSKSPSAFSLADTDRGSSLSRSPSTLPKDADASLHDWDENAKSTSDMMSAVRGNLVGEPWQDRDGVEENLHLSTADGWLYTLPGC